MSTQIQTTAGEMAKAYEAKVVELQRIYDEGAARYVQVKAQWNARSWWYRFWHGWERPYWWNYFDEGIVEDAEKHLSMYRGFSPESPVFVDEHTAEWLRLNEVSGA